jgi:putrescine transport system permease protein
VAVNAATLSTVFGVLIALAFVRYGNFRFRLLLSALASTPLVMPEVVTGLSLLLLFIAMEGFLGWPAGRGLGHHHHRPHDLWHVFRRRCRAVAAP